MGYVSWRKVLAAVAVVGGALALPGCGDPGADAVEVAKACGQQRCPVGTALRESRSVTTGSDISGGYDPVTYKADGAYKRLGSGQCEYICQLIQPCPDGTFPVITEDCFTCGAIGSGGAVAQGACK